ncbi:MAG: chemotaxis protein CheC [Candidatus Hodarchaeales archaeon]|jgi:chemotaxis protein CheC
MSNDKKYHEDQIDALSELGNIGSGHAASALAEILNRRIDMSLPRFSLLSTTDLSKVKWRNYETSEIFAVIVVEIQGNMRMEILVVFDLITTEGILQLIGKEIKDIDFDDLTSFDKSIIREVGNILALHYLTAINQFLGISNDISNFPALPILIIESSETILASIATHLHPDFSHLLLVECDIFTSDVKLTPIVILIPEEHTIEKSLQLMFGEQQD